jgi:2-C-methyl-D-erythritol 4-phosphate cytidylyltransferase
MKEGNTGSRPMVGAVIAGAGEGRRLSASGRKQFAKVAGRPIITYALEIFEKSPLIDHMVVVIPRDSMEWFREEVLDAGGYRKVLKAVPGGETRQRSVYNGLRALKNKTSEVIVHDAARPLVSEALIKRVLGAASKTGAAISAVPPKDTVKQVESGQVVGTLDRRLLWLAQTPQCFRYDILVDAHRRAVDDGFEATDDASLVEKYGSKVVVAVGSYSNLKITSPEDLPMFEYFLKQENRLKLHSARQEPKGKSGRKKRRSRSGRSRRPRSRRKKSA